MSALQRALKIRPGETRLVLSMTTLSFVGMAGLAIGQSGANALFFDRIGTDALPLMYLAQGATAFVFMMGLAALLGRVDRRRAYLAIPAGLGAVVVKPDHVRSVDAIVERYGARPYGPSLFWRHDIPDTELEPIEPGSEMPGGLVALYDGRGRNETPVWLPEQGAIVFADALTERRGTLLVWGTPWHEERVLPALRAMLDLPFEHVIVSHGEPVHDRAAFERALELPPWVE